MTSNALVFQPIRPRTPRPNPLRPIHPGTAALAAIVVVIALATAGCAGSPKPPHAWVVDDGMVEVDTQGRGLLFVKPDHQLGRYDELLIEEVGFRYRDGQRFLSYRREDQLSSMLDDAIRGVGNGKVGLAEVPGPCVLSVRFYVRDLELHDPSWKSGSSTSYVASYGEATMVMELRDSVEDEPLARFVQRRELGGGWGEALGVQDSLSRLDRAVSRAMGDMGGQLQRLTPPTSRGWDAQCRGNLTRVALGAR